MRFPRLQVTMTHNQRFRITLMQILQQTSQRTFLCLRTGIAGSLAVSSKPSHVSHPDGMPVMVFAVRSHHLLRSARLNGAVRRNHIVVATAYPTQRTMIAVDVRHPQGTARPISGAMHDNQSNLPHRNCFLLYTEHTVGTDSIRDLHVLRVEIHLEHLRGSATRCARQNQFNHSDYVEHDALPVCLHTRCL